jgi:hypothetical protein
MSESGDTGDTDRMDSVGRVDPAPATTTVYREGDAVAGVVTVADATVVLGHASGVADGLASGEVVPTHYVDVAPSVPESYVAALHVSGARIHDAVDLRRRVDGLYADGFSVAPGVGVLPCNPSRTVVVRLRDRGAPVDLLFSNAPADERVASESLSGALPLYGTLDTATGESRGRTGEPLGDDEVTGRDPADDPTVVAVGDRAAAVLDETESVAADVVVTARDGTSVVVDADGAVTESG